MRFVIALSVALVAMIVGITAWNILPENQAFSWVEMSGNEYLIGDVATQIDRNSPEFRSMADFPEAIASLRNTVSGNYHVYASLGTLGQRLQLQSGVSFPIFKQDYVSSEYFTARNVTLQAGRHVQSGETNAYVLGDRLARDIFAQLTEAVGQDVLLYSNQPGQLDREVEIVGVLAPSPAQDPDHDPDTALVGSLEGLLERNALYERLALHLYLVLPDDSQGATLTDIEEWTAAYFGEQADVRLINEVAERRAATIASLSPRIESRRTVLLLFGLVLSVAALLALYAQGYWRLLRRLQLLGIDKALGAPTARLIRTLVFEHLPWGALGGIAGIVLLWLMHSWLPAVFPTRPPVVVLTAAFLVPLSALLLLALLLSRSLLLAPPMELIRGKVQGARIRPLIIMVYAGLALALAGGLAATSVEGLVNTEAAELEQRFGQLQSLQTGSPVIDPRAEQAFESGDFRPVFNQVDAEQLRSLVPVKDAAVAQALPNLTIESDDGQVTTMAVAADTNYVTIMGLTLSAGDSSGCIATPTLLQELSSSLGDTLTLAGVAGPVTCTVTGVLQPHNPLWSWLVIDLPELIAPPMDGLGLALPGYDGTRFASTRVLLQMHPGEDDTSIREWLRLAHPGQDAELVPTTPDAQSLLVNLTVQASLFSLMALLAMALSFWSLIGGFWALLEAERFKTALDRALGLTVDGITRRWWRQMAALGLISFASGTAVSYLVAVALYDALALDIPNLPQAAAVRLDGTAVLMALGMILLLSALLSIAGRRWLTSQSTLQLLKEGSI